VRQFYFPIFPLARFLVESNVGESTFRIQGASFGKRASEPDPGNTEYRVDFRHCAPSLCPTSAKEIWFCSNGCHWPRPVGGDAGAEPRHCLRACGARPSGGPGPGERPCRENPGMTRKAVFSEGRTLCVRKYGPDRNRGMSSRLPGRRRARGQNVAMLWFT
jgi:hypothetical protein